MEESKRNLIGNILASFYIDANTLDEGPMIDGTRPEQPELFDSMLKVLHDNLDENIDWPQGGGRVEVEGKSIDRLNWLLSKKELHYNGILCEELCNRQTRMLFRNMMFETSFELEGIMPLMRREVHRILFRLYDEGDETTGKIGWEESHVIDMPYRSKTFVQKSWNLISEYVQRCPLFCHIWGFIYEQEYIHSELEVQLKENERLAAEARQDFTEVVHGRWRQRVHPQEE